MGYRDPSPPEPTTLSYGPFPAAKSELFFFVIAFLIGAGALVGSTHRKVFECERADGSVRCQEETSLLSRVTLRRSFEGDELSSVEWRPYSGSRNKEMGRTDLFDARGEPTAVLQGARDDAHDYHRDLRHFLDHPERAHLQIEQQNALWVGLVLGALAWLWAFFMARAFIRTGGRFEVVVDAAAETITVRGRHLGVLRSERVHPLKGLVGIAVEHTFLKRTRHSRGAQGDPAGQLRLDYAEELPRKLTATPLPGSEVHEDLAERLREVTGLKPQTRPVVVGDATPSGETAARRKTRRWVLGLTLAAPLLAAGLGFGLEAAFRDSGGALVHLRAERRCKFQGAELLPGAEMSVVLEPGTYVVEIYEPSEDWGWRTDHLEVTEGEGQLYVCR